MGRKRAKKQVVILGKILSLYGPMLIEPKQGTPFILVKAYSPGAFTLYTNQLTTREETKLIWGKSGGAQLQVRTASEC